MVWREWKYEIVDNKNREKRASLSKSRLCHYMCLRNVTPIYGYIKEKPKVCIIDLPQPSASVRTIILE